jgi:exodeoxyribonuclease VII small subunit
MAKDKSTTVEQEVSFEDKLKNAKEILERLSDPKIPLKEAMLEYKKGITILNEATKIIEDAKLEYEQLQFGQEN